MITYYLQKNPFQNGKQNYIGKPYAMATLHLKDLIEKCSNKGNKIPEYLIEGVICRLEEVIEDALKNGQSINTPLINIQPAITGIFDDKHDKFDSNRHTLHYRISQGTLLKKFAKQSELLKIIPPKSLIQIYSIKNLSSASPELIFEKGSILELKGKSLKYDTNDTMQGIFLVHESGKEYRVGLSLKSTKSIQMFQIPLTIDKGSYKIQVRCLPPRYQNIKIGEYEKAISVI